LPHKKKERKINVTFGNATPCATSLYSSIDAFLDIENELVNFIVKDMKCALVGDFNAKTAVLEDFSEPDESFLNVMDVNVEDGQGHY
jgi:hypothetical protein